MGSTSDSQEALADLLNRLDTLAGADISALVNHALPAFSDFCQKEGMSDFLLLHHRQLKGFDSVPDRFSQPF